MENVKLQQSSSKKKKSVLDFYIFKQLLNSKDYYIIENNIKNFDKKKFYAFKCRKLMKSGILLSRHIIFSDINLLKYYLSFIYFINLKDFYAYVISTNKRTNFLPVIIKVKFLFFKQMSVFSKYSFTYEGVCFSLNLRLKPIYFLK